MADKTVINDSRSWIHALGPGLVMAGAAIGVSHLVQSTRAGAEYGYFMIVLIVLACVFKYPFLEFGPRYAAATGESLLDGYRRLGRWALVLFGLITLGTMFIIMASVTAVAAGLAAQFTGVLPNITLWSAAILLGCILLLLGGRYRLLDRTMKVIMALLALSTVAAVVAGLFVFGAADGAALAPEAALFTAGGLAFALALMGWMPIPIDVAVWHSLWTLERRRESGYTPSVRDAVIDFNLGYWISLAMAVFFLLLGAFVMYGTGERFPAEAVPFSTRLVELYTQTLGAWSGPVIGFAAVVTMFSTTLAVTDAYPRVLQRYAALAASAKASEPEDRNFYLPLLFVTPIGALVIIAFFANNLTALVDVATILSFLSAPVLGYMNYLLVTGPAMPEETRPGPALRYLSWAGLVFLLGFSAAFLYVFYLA